MKYHSPHRFISRLNAGFSLIEVLIALLVLSFGVLSALGLQVVASSNVQNANQRATAVYLANDLLDRIRSNTIPDANDVFVNKTQGVELGNATLGASAPVGCTEPDGCNAPDMALLSLWQWEQLLDGQQETISVSGNAAPVGGLIDPAACVFSPVLGGDGRYRVVVVWRSASESANPEFNDAEVDGCANEANQYGTDNVHRRVVSISSYIAR